MEHFDEVIEVKKRPTAEGRPILEQSIQGKAVLESIDDSDRTTTKRPTSSLPRKSGRLVERLTSESESSDSGPEDNAKLIIEGFDYRQWENLEGPPELKELYQYIAR